MSQESPDEHRQIGVDRMRMTGPDRSAGFTMIELLVVMVIMGALGAMATSGWMRYQRGVEHRGSAQELSAALRNAQQSALAEAVTYCVRIDASAGTYTTFKFACGSSGTSVKTGKTQSPRVALESASFQQPDGTSNPTVSFTPRGSATKGSVKVTRAGADKDYTITVEGLTGRVSLTG